MSQGTLSGITTLLSLLAFVGVALWAYSARKRADFDAAARIPLEDHEAHHGERAP